MMSNPVHMIKHPNESKFFRSFNGFEKVHNLNEIKAKKTKTSSKKEKQIKEEEKRNNKNEFEFEYTVMETSRFTDYSSTIDIKQNERIEFEQIIKDITENKLKQTSLQPETSQKK